MNKEDQRIYILIFAFTLLSACLRLLPHPYHFTPIGALALLSASQIRHKVYAFFPPILAMMITDIFYGFHSTLFFVYAGFLLTVVVGFVLTSSRGILKLGGASLAGSIVFYLISNLGVWWATPLYPSSTFGLMECYIAAIPFFHWSLLGNLFYTFVFFGLFELANRYFLLRFSNSKG